MLALASGAAAQKDAAEKVQEGGIDHWIEYYKADQRKPAAAPQPPSQPIATPASPAAPGASTQGKTTR